MSSIIIPYLQSDINGNCVIKDADVVTSFNSVDYTLDELQQKYTWLQMRFNALLERLEEMSEYETVRYKDLKV